MIDAKTLKTNKVDSPPPGGGRTVFANQLTDVQRWCPCDFCRSARATWWRTPPERDANLTHRDGETTGNRFLTCSNIGALIFVAYCFAFIYCATQLAQSPLFRCHPGDRATTNGRDLCPPHEVRR